MNGQNRNPLVGVTLAVFVVLGLLLLIPMVVMPVFGGMMSGGMMSGGTWGNGYWWGWPVMLLFWVLLIGGIALVVAWLFRQGYLGAPYGRHNGNDGNRGSSAARNASDAHDAHDPVNNDNSAGRGGAGALDILKQRYARGEITKEVYEQMKQDILAD